MIAYVRGTVGQVGPDEAVVEVGGLGIAVRCTPATLATLRVGQPHQVATSLVVREDSLTLYGFADEDEREIFEILQTATGVGPRLALAMLGVLRPDALRRAVATGDLAVLTQVPGIGRKGAQRIVLELKDRLGPPTGSASSASMASTAAEAEDPRRATRWQAQVHTALLGLGWSTREAEQGVAAVTPLAERDGEAPPDVSTLLKAALRALDRSGSGA
jgi:holliday junction DNA helicase RuvA